MRNKIVSADEAVAVIRSSDTLAVSGFVGVGTPDEIIIALERRFLTTQQPSDLSLVFAAAPGDGQDRGLNRLARKGLVRRLIGGHYGLVPKLARMAVEGQVEAYNLPLGCVSHLFREIAGGKPGLLSKVGLRTFVDPRNGGGKLNSKTNEDLVSLLELEGKSWLFFRAFPIHVAIIRGTTADAQGNITMEREALTLDCLTLAMAAKNSKGLVIAQVERIAAPGSLHPRSVRVPGALIDCVVLSRPENHLQTYGTSYHAGFSGEVRAPAEALKRLPLDERKIIARRAAFELPMGGVVNLGIGVPEGIAAVAAEEKLLEHVTLTAEPGIIGGLPQGGLDFGAALNAEAIIDQNQQFDFYDGGGLDLACLGMAQVDRQGNVNVSLFNGRLAGAGGFINISQNARRLIFAGAFTAGGLRVAAGNGRLEILREGRSAKFVDAVEQVTYSAETALENNQSVLFVTERCVFRLEREGLELIEVAPGIEIDRDITSLMPFSPVVRQPKPMNPRIFQPEPMELFRHLLERPLAERFSFDFVKTNVLFLNFEGFHVRSVEDVEAVRALVILHVGHLGRKISAVINYDGWSVEPSVADQWFAMAAELECKFYDRASRYTTSAFLRLKLGEALTYRNVSPQVFENSREARRFLSKDSQWG